MGELIISPSGALVEIKEVRESISIVYQLDSEGKRIKERKADGRMDYLHGIISNVT